MSRYLKMIICKHGDCHRPHRWSIGSKWRLMGLLELVLGWARLRTETGATFRNIPLFALASYAKGGGAPLQNFGDNVQSKVHDVSKDQGQDNGGIAVNAKAGSVGFEFPPRDFFIGWGTGITSIRRGCICYLCIPRPKRYFFS